MTEVESYWNIQQETFRRLLMYIYETTDVNVSLIDRTRGGNQRGFAHADLMDLNCNQQLLEIAYEQECDITFWRYDNPLKITTHSWNTDYHHGEKYGSRLDEFEVSEKTFKIIYDVVYGLAMKEAEKEVEEERQRKLEEAKQRKVVAHLTSKLGVFEH